jgi:hypothetical protein
MVPVTVPLSFAVAVGVVNVMEYVPLSVVFVVVLALTEKVAGEYPPVVEFKTMLPFVSMAPVMSGLMTPNGNAQGMPLEAMHSGKAICTQAMPETVLPDCVK